MTKSIKLCIIGGGSSYTPELIQGVIDFRDELHIDELALMDIDEGKLAVVGGLASRMMEAAGLKTQVKLYDGRLEAIKGAQFVISQIRVGGLDARIRDEKIPMEFGLLGQETTGPGGFANALRTIPVALLIAEDMRKVAPDAFLINFTNPSGIITEALVKYGRVKTIGLCNVPFNMKEMIAGWLGVTAEEVTMDYVGLNHLSWVRRVFVAGKDVTQDAIGKAVEAWKRSEGHGFDPSLLKLLGMIPSSYLRYYYDTPGAIAEVKAAGETRGEAVKKLEPWLMKLYSDPDLKQAPAELSKRGGRNYSKVAISLISSIANCKDEVHIVNTVNLGAIPDLPVEAVVEVPSVISGDGAHPLVTRPLEPEIRGLTQAVKAYEELTVEAGVTGDRNLALKALLSHPLVPSYRVAKELLERLLEANRAFLPKFFAD
ncbi:MAG: 6-phospho-beta-glucosidase [Firmicutes bacterium]|nr:6-phospho-beta-glucosidase [Bacillota bacterium]